MRCPNCGRNNPMMVRSCPDCGQKMSFTAPLMARGTAPLGAIFGQKANPSESFFQQGLKLFEEGKMNEAAEVLEQAIAQDRGNHQALAYLGRISALIGDNIEAEQHLLTALDLAVSHPLIHYFLGDLYFNQREFIEAENHFKRAIEGDRKLLDAQLRLGLLYQETNRPKDALRCFDQAIYLDRTSVPARLFLAQLCIQEEDLKRALAQLHYISGLQGTTADTLMLQGDIHKKLGDLRQAILEYGKAVELRPEDAEFHWKHGTALLALGEKRKALRALRKVLELAPDRYNAVLLAAQLQEEAMQFTQAMNNYQKLLDVSEFAETAQEGIERVQARLEAIRADMAGGNAEGTP